MPGGIYTIWHVFVCVSEIRLFFYCAKDVQPEQKREQADRASVKFDLISKRYIWSKKDLSIWVIHQNETSLVKTHEQTQFQQSQKPESKYAK